MATKRPIYLLVLLILLIAAALVLRQLFPQSLHPSEATSQSITKTGAAAFGDLSISTISTGAERSSSDTAAPDIAVGEGTDIKIAPESRSFRFLAPEALPQLFEDVDVLSWASSSTSITDVIQSTRVGVFDFSLVPDSSLDTLTATTADGYRVELNLVDGTVAISEADLREVEEASENTLDDAQIIAIADRFLTRFGISKEGYSDPVVERAEVFALDIRSPEESLLAPDKFIPTQANVVYPLRVDGTRVLALWGGIIGITVNVDLPRERVSNLSGARQLNLESSSYTGSTQEQFLGDLATGGLGGIFMDGTVASVDVQLGSPEMALVSVYQYDTTTRELLVPAYRFPTLNAPDGAPSEIIVPLVPDLVHYPSLEPAFDGASGEGSNGSAAGSTEAAPAE